VRHNRRISIARNEKNRFGVLDGTFFPPKVSQEKCIFVSYNIFDSEDQWFGDFETYQVFENQSL